MQQITEELPKGAVLVIEGEFGTRVHYVGTDLELRTHLIRNEWFTPNFLLDDVGPRMIRTLKKDLLRSFPNASEIRSYERGGEVVFLCSVEVLHELQ
jgi:hypothetical protein